VAAGDRLLVLLWCAALAAIVGAIESGRVFQVSAAQVGLGTAIGGSASNLFDRLRRRAVIDFLDLRCWPVFNVADVGITVGAIAALWWR
jgi:signal peptidase II